MKSPITSNYPKELKQYYESNPAGHSYIFKSNGLLWANPLTLKEVLEIMAEYPHARIISGNTEVGIEQRFKNQISTVFINPSAVPEMLTFQVSDESVLFGGAMTINTFRKHLSDLIKSRPVRCY